ncbi:MAG: META domain-containing protein [Alistipes sp.]|nr:META domain-containing protein [Alistipes sp.]
MKRSFLIMFAAALVAITGCCNCTSRSREVKPLVGTDWHLVQIMGRDVQKPADSYTITFGQDGRLNGVGDCNRLMSEYKTDDSRKLTFEYPASTRMMCPDQASEDEFLQMLSRVTHYEMDGEQMLLLSNGELLAIFEALPEGEAK